MPANPFAAASPAAVATSAPAWHQSWLLAIAGALAALLSLLLGNLQALLQHPQYGDFLLEDLPARLVDWSFTILFTALSAALFSRGYFEQQGVACKRPRRVALGFAIALLLIDQLYGLLYGMLDQRLYDWLSASGLPLSITYDVINLLGLIITTLAPLWLVLHLSARRPQAPVPLVGHEAALLLGACVALLQLKAVQLTPLHLFDSSGGWSVPLYASALLAGALVGACAWRNLPPSLARMRPGQLALTALVIFLIWLLANLLVAALLLVAIMLGGDPLWQLLLLIVFGSTLLVLLWPLTLLGLRWIYRADAV